MDEVTHLPGVIPDGLLRDIHKGDGVLFLGTDYPNGLPVGNVPPGRQAFADKLVAEIDGPTEPGSSPWEIAEIYETEYGRSTLVSALRKWIDEAGTQPYPIHHAVARLPVEAIITTAYDDRLEQALRAAGKSPVAVVSDIEVPFVSADKVMVLKLFGDAKRPESLVLTEDDQYKLSSRLAPLLSVVRYLFVIKTLLFVGYDLSDNLFKSLYAEVSRSVRGYQRLGYAVWPGVTDLDCRRWEKKGVCLLDVQPALFLSRLEAEVTQLASEAEEVPISLELLDRDPYKFLDYFKPEDTEIFFGREVESLLLWRKILSYRLVVLFGSSGSGKTSLLNAGVWPRLVRYGYHVCSVRVHTDPTHAVREAVQKTLPPGRRVSAQDSGALPMQEGLRAFFSRILEPTDRLVIFLDQFEELFVALPPRVQKRFLRAIADCLRDESWEVRFVLALREDFLPRLETYRDLLLQYYANSLRLERLGRAAAELAITEPARQVGFVYEPALVQSMLDDLEEDGGIAPPQLQIVCDRLYDHAVSVAQRIDYSTLMARVKSIFPQGQPVQTVKVAITYDQYNSALGGARTILADYVDEVIAELPEPQCDTAHSILKAMVTPEKTKAVLTQEEIVGRSRSTLGQVAPALENLVNYRLVRQLKGEHGTLYELAHEHLIAKIRDWVSPEELDAENAHKLMDQQVMRYRELHSLIDAKTLQVIDQQRENPHFVLAAEEIELLFRSALSTRYELAYWVERAHQSGFPVDRVLHQELESKDFRSRAAAVAALGQLGARFIQPIIKMLSDEYPQVRVAAISTLEQLQPSGLWRGHLQYECYVPAGEFIMGDDYGDRAERPANEVYLNAFYIEKYPVTNAEYKHYMDDRGNVFEIPAGKADHPVVQVSWYDALDYATWAGMRLLTEAEWEKAASWCEDTNQKRAYPWGNTFDRKMANTSESGISDTTPVTKHEAVGTSPFGVVDMAGNVWEWTSSLWGTSWERPHFGYPYEPQDGREALDAPDNVLRVRRGGAFNDPAELARCAYRNKVAPALQSSTRGFRVGLSASTALSSEVVDEERRSNN